MSANKSTRATRSTGAGAGASNGSGQPPSNPPSNQPSAGDAIGSSSDDADITEHERRDMVRELRRRLAARNHRLSRSEAIFMLQLAGWELDIAIQDFAGLIDARQRLSREFDHMRTPQPDQVEQDERLALFITITGRPDHNSLLEFLTHRNWDLVAAVVAWYTEGVPVVLHKKDRHGEGRRVDTTGISRPAPTEQEAEAGKDEDRSQWIPDSNEFRQGGTALTPTRATNPRSAPGRTQGFIINENRASVKPGTAQHDKFLIEYIHKGKYKFNKFANKDFKWSPTDRGKPVFDFNRAADVDKLNNWRRQNRHRITQEDIRPSSQIYSQEENDFLYAQSEEYVQKLRKSTGKPRRDLVPFTVSADLKEQWTKEFNAKFVGKQPEGHRRPVTPRKSGALMTARHRYAKLQVDFKLTPDCANPKRKAPSTPTPSRGSKKAKVAVEEEEEVDEEEAEEDQEEIASPVEQSPPASPASKPSLPGGSARSRPTSPAQTYTEAPWANLLLGIKLNYEDLPEREDALAEGLDSEGYLRSEGFADLVQIHTINITRGIRDNEPIQWAAAINTVMDYFRTRRTDADYRLIRSFLDYIGYIGQLDPRVRNLDEIIKELHARWQEALVQQRKGQEAQDASEKRSQDSEKGKGKAKK